MSKHTLEELASLIEGMEETRENFGPLREAKRLVHTLLKDAEAGK